MKYKNIIAIISVSLFLINTCGFARAVRKPRDTKAKASQVRVLAAKNDVFLDDYTDCEEGSAPKGYKLGGMSNGTIAVKKINVMPGLDKNCLELHDASNDPAHKYAGVNVTRNFDRISTRFAVETRFKFVPDTTPNCSYEYYLQDGSNTVNRIIAWSSDGVLSYENAGASVSLATTTMLDANTWYTIRLVGDFTTKKADILIISDAVKSGKIPGTVTEKDLNKGIVITRNLGIKQEATGFNNIYIDTQVNDGTYYIDYLKVEKDPEDIPFLSGERSRPDPIKAPIVAGPTPHPVSGTLNVSYNGEYVYFATKPILDNGIAMVNAKSAAEIFKMKYNLKGESVIFERNGTKITFKTDIDIAYINNVEKSAGTIIKRVDNKVFVPLRFIAESVGATINWDGETKTIIISEEVAQ